MNKTAKQILENDKNKILLAKKKYNYDTLVIWEDDVKNNKQKELKKCVDFINS